MFTGYIDTKSEAQPTKNLKIKIMSNSFPSEKLG